jgi:hypothetical protein
MDLLKSLNLEDLPEQQTRAAHLLDTKPDFEGNLGFDSCCACGTPDPSLQCPGCQRVKYCCMECKTKDSEPPVDESEQALGHSSIICAVLRLCNDDDAVDEGTADASISDNSQREAAINRVVSEYESYPATLSNVLMGGPCYQDALYESNGGTLTIHIIGASTDSEFWVGHPSMSSSEGNSSSSLVWNAYADALSELADRHKIETIELVFVGPDCPVENVKESSLRIPGTSCNLKIESFNVSYGQNLTSSLNAPNVVVFFNPGFTCPDYDWNDTLSCIKKGTPFLLTTNTELEGVADAQYLLDHDMMGTMPPGLADILGASEEEGDNSVSDSFFDMNPFCGERVRQSGTMANDLYVKSRWMLGGTLGKSKEISSSTATSSKRVRVEGSGNSKASNPALI